VALGLAVNRRNIRMLRAAVIVSDVRLACACCGGDVTGVAPHR
jgi:hypothetical protein